MKNQHVAGSRGAPEVTVLHIGDLAAGDEVARSPLSIKNVKAFLWDKAQFVLVSAFVFVVSYLVLNYQSIYQNLEYKWKFSHADVKEFEASVLPADAPMGEVAQPVSAPGGVAQSSASSSESGVPALNIKVMPSDTRIVIPRIFKNIPVIGASNSSLIARDWDALEKDIQQALRNGVVHYPGTSLPGERGNVVITGHSSFYAWDPGRFKDVFGLLHELKPKDRIYLFHNQKQYAYEVFDIRVVKPTEIDVLGQTNDERLTLITCTPLGTNLKRLIVTAKRI